MKIKSNQDIRIISHNPTYDYTFELGETKDIPDEHAEKILKNKDFISLDKKKKIGGEKHGI